MIDLLAITDDPPAHLPVGADLCTVECAGLAALCGPAQDGELSVVALWRHEEIVEEWMRDCDLLPARFGTRLRDETEVAALLAGRREEFLAALDRVRGSVELSVRVVEAGSRNGSAQRPATGADYMRARRRLGDARVDATKSVHHPLAALARESDAHGGTHENEVLRAAYLVDRRAVTPFAARVAALEHQNPALRLLCTGPWPPYSFVER